MTGSAAAERPHAPPGRTSRDALGLAAPYREPHGPLETAVADAFASALRLDRTGMDDDFFDLGGDSVAAAEIVVALEPLAGDALQPGLLVELATPRRLAAWISERTAGQPAPGGGVLVAVRGGRRPPVFIVPGASGFTFLRPAFMAGLAPDQPVLTFRLRGLDGRQPSPGSVEEAAAENAAALIAAWPEGPVNLVSFCVGAQVAIEMVHRLQSLGRKPARLVLIDPRIDPLSLMVAAARRGGGSWSPAAGERWLMLRRTGRPSRLVDADGNLSAAMRARIVEAARKRHGKLNRDSIERASGGAVERGIEAVAQWQAHLRNHCPAAWLDPVDVVFSATRARQFAEGQSEIRSFVPNANVVEVGGEHSDLFDLNGTQTAQILQSLLDNRP